MSRFAVRPGRLLLVLLCAALIGGLGYVYARRTEPAEYRMERLSIQELLKKSEAERENELVWSSLGRRFLAQGLPREAEQAFRTALSAQPASLRAAAGYACAIGLSGDWNRAQRLLDELEAHNPPSPTLCYYRGLLRQESGDTTGATPYFERAVQLNPFDAESWYRLARCHAEQGVKARALEAALRAHRLNDSRVEFHVYAADLSLLTGDAQWGKARMQEAIQRWPKEALPRLTEAKRLLRDKAPGPAERARAGQLLRDAVALAPQWGDARVELARYDFNQNDFEAARQELEQLPEPLRKTGEAGYLLGQTYLRLGRREEGARLTQEYQRFTRRRLDCAHLETLSEQSPGDISLHLRAARCLAALGSRLPALRHYYEVLRVEPDNKEARRELQTLSRGDS